MTPSNEAESELCLSSSHFPTFRTLFHFLSPRLRISLRHKGSENYSQSSFLLIKYILFFSPFCRKFPSTTPDPRWPFSKMYYFRGDARGWDGWMASPTRWTWVWVNSGRWWWTGRPGVLRFMGSQRVGPDWATELSYFREKLLLFIEGYFPEFYVKDKMVNTEIGKTPGLPAAQPQAQVSYRFPLDRRPRSLSPCPWGGHHHPLYPGHPLFQEWLWSRTLCPAPSAHCPLPCCPAKSSELSVWFNY